MELQEPRRERDRLALLANAHWVVGALAFLAAAVPAFYASLGLDVIFAAATPAQAETGWRIFLGGLAWVVGAFAYVMLLVAAARALRLHRRYRLVVAVSLLSLAFVPFGTLLAVATLVTLRDREVRERFGRAVAHRGPRSVSRPPGGS